MMWPMVLFVVKDWLMNVGDLSNENSIPKSIKLGLFTGAFLMGLIVFFEALPFDIRA